MAATTTTKAKRTATPDPELCPARFIGGEVFDLTGLSLRREDFTHRWQAWGSDARYERCSLCGTARRSGVTPAQSVNPMVLQHGPGPEGSTCGGCGHLRTQGGTAGRYFKCELRKNTRGSATDMRKKWPACVRFLPAEPEPKRPRTPRGQTVEGLVAEMVQQGQGQGGQHGRPA